MATVFQTLVIGAGQAGLAAGYHLQRHGLHFAILEGSNQAAGSWPAYYESLTLFSPARYASLPGMPFPGDPDHYPTRNEVIDYLTGYAARFTLPVITHARVTQVERRGEHFHVQTADGRHYQSQTVIAATGAFHRPTMPQLPGQEHFEGQIQHAATYRTPEPFQGKRVVVVGAGNSALQIAYELAQVTPTTLATREPVKFTPQHLLGRDIHFWLRVTGIDTSSLAIHPRLRPHFGVLDRGRYQAALASGQIAHTPMFSGFTPHGIVWADGREAPADVVLFATGYRPNLDYLRGLDALDERGAARHRHGISLATPGLAFVGLSQQRSIASATLRGVGADADFVIRHLARHLTSTHAPSGFRVSQTNLLP